ncbi:DMT family transporter [Haladaptatus caseinilyticus]|uniref:DMT family transporter n=1 Tax=Haladaptatus caseinilyticus TaxID=2993314 RepID=UPI00224ABC39|nr:DMT family transporter [Haladaptatus caseinilyticus]
MLRLAIGGIRDRNDLTLLATVLVWGVNFAVLKVALADLNPFVVNSLRFTVSALVLGGVYLAGQRGSNLQNSLLQPVRAGGWQVVALGVLGYWCFPVAFIVGMDATTAGNAALIMASAPLWTAMVSQFIGLERLGGLAWLGLLVAVVGTAVVVFGGGGVALGGSTMVGNAIVLLAAILWGVYTALNRPVLDRVSPLALTFFGLLVALPFLHLLAVPYYGSVEWGSITLPVWGAVVFTGALGTGLAIVWWNSSVQAVGPSTTGVYGNVVPIVALASGLVFLNEPIGAVQLLGTVLIIGGVLVVRRAKPVMAEEYDECRSC